MNLRILLFARNGNASPAIRSALEREGVEMDECRSFVSIRRLLRARQYAIVVSTCLTLDRSQSELARFLRSLGARTPLFVVVQEAGNAEATRILAEGATKVLFPPDVERELIKELKRFSPDPPVDSPKPVGDVTREITLIGESQSIRDVRSAIELVANSSTAVLITGESGTGKEVVARSIHLKSPRKDKPFVGINCAALPKDVIENELFGHERGAFTGALTKKMGCFDLANGGTLFFDEIAEMNPDTQAKLLRAIELKAFRRLGGEREINVDVRTVAATNKPIAEALRSGDLRQDLYYRFSVIEILLPPLRERPQDIPLLISHFLSDFSSKYAKHVEGFDDAAMNLIFSYDWPGNVRQLRNAIERGIVTCKGDKITLEDLPPNISHDGVKQKAVNIPVGLSLAQAERMFIEKTLERTDFNKSRAARILHISRKTLHTKLEEFGESPEQYHLSDGVE